MNRYLLARGVAALAVLLFGVFLSEASAYGRSGYKDPRDLHTQRAKMGRYTVKIAKFDSKPFELPAKKGPTHLYRGSGSRPPSHAYGPSRLDKSRRSAPSSSRGLLFPILLFMGLATTTDALSVTVTPNANITPNACGLSQTDYGILYATAVSVGYVPSNNLFEWGRNDMGSKRTLQIPFPSECMSDAIAIYLAGCSYDHYNYSSIIGCPILGNLSTTDASTFATCSALNGTLINTLGQYGMNACGCSRPLTPVNIPSGCKVVADVLIYSACYSTAGCSDQFCQAIARSETNAPCETPTPRTSLNTIFNTCGLSNLDYGVVYQHPTFPISTYGIDWAGFGYFDTYYNHTTRAYPLPSTCGVVDAEAAYLTGCAYQNSNITRCLEIANLPATDASTFNACSTLNSTLITAFGWYGSTACAGSETLAPVIPIGCEVIAGSSIYAGCYGIGGCSNAFCQVIARGGTNVTYETPTPRANLTTTPNTCGLSNLNHRILYQRPAYQQLTSIFAITHNLVYATWFSLGSTDLTSNTTRRVPLPRDGCIIDAEVAYLAGCMTGSGATIARCRALANFPATDTPTLNTCSSLSNAVTIAWGQYGVDACRGDGIMTPFTVPSGCEVFARQIIYSTCYGLAACSDPYCQQVALEGSQTIGTMTLTETDSASHTGTFSSAPAVSHSRTPTPTRSPSGTILATRRVTTTDSPTPSTTTTHRPRTSSPTYRPSDTASGTDRVTSSSSHTMTDSPAPSTTTTRHPRTSSPTHRLSDTASGTTPPVKTTAPDTSTVSPAPSVTITPVQKSQTLSGKRARPMKLYSVSPERTTSDTPTKPLTNSPAPSTTGTPDTLSIIKVNIATKCGSKKTCEPVGLGNGRVGFKCQDLCAQ